MLVGIAAFALPAFLAVAAAAPPRLEVSENHRYLVTEGGKPFLYLADTAWELFHRLNREEATRYLENRARKGFTVIQAVALAELDGLNTPNAYGHRPLLDNDPTRPDVREGPANDYWDHVDYVIHEALDHPGVFQMGHLRRLFESRPFLKLVPDEAMIGDGPRSGGGRIRAARADDGSFAFVYSPRGEPFAVRLDAIKTSSGVRTWWFDPRYGTASSLYTGDAVAMQTFTPPSQGRGQDWLLVLDDAARGYPVPGRP